MQDLQQTLEQLLDYIKGVWIKKRYVILSSWIICSIGFVYVATRPDVYDSQARVFVDTQSVLQPLLKGLAIQTNPQQEVAMMVKTLLSRPNLEIIARESDLDVAAKNASQYENMVNSLASNIRLNSAGRDNLYTISYTNRDPQRAQTVVQETLNLLVESTLGNSRKDTDTASQFLDEQLGEYENRLNQAEQRLADFKRKYSELLPNKGSFYQNYRELETLLEETRLTIKETEQQMNTLTAEVKGRSPKPSNSGATLETQYDERIRTLERSLDELNLKYTNLHPDVVETNNLLNTLKSERKKELDAYYSDNEDGSNDEIGSITSELKLEASRLQSQIASLKVRENNYQNKINELKQQIDLVPQVEAELTALNRDYGITKKQYEELLTRKESNDLSKKADVSSEDVKFRVIDPPLAPVEPSGPNRIIGYTIVLFLGFAVGVAIAFLISQLNPIVVKGRQLTSLTSYPVLGVVSDLNKVQIGKAGRSRMIVFILSSCFILMVYASLVSLELMHVNIYSRIFS